MGPLKSRSAAVSCRTEVCYPFGRKHGRDRAVKRREFITLLGGAAAAWPIVARAQQPDRIRRIGVLIAAEAQDDPIAQAQVAAFRQELEKLGWTEGRNVRIDARFAAGDPARVQSYAVELARLKPDVALAQTSVAVTAMLRESPSLPLVFVQINDPLGSGFVASLARPGGNITGFTPAEFSMGAKMLEVLKDVAPHISHVTVLLNPDQVPGVMTWRTIEAAAPTVAVHAVSAGIHEPRRHQPRRRVLCQSARRRSHRAGVRPNHCPSQGDHRTRSASPPARGLHVSILCP
jgi:putative tryptophan/tyrosine transport system substrate-binding protein